MPSAPADEIDELSRRVAALEAEREQIRQEEAEVLRALAEGTSDTTGNEFFDSLVRSLAQVLGVEIAFVAELDTRTGRAETLALWVHDTWREPYRYALPGTVCERVVDGQFCHYPDLLEQRFPDDGMVRDLDAQSYLGVPMRSTDGAVMGHVAVLHTAPMPDRSSLAPILRLFANRASSELRRLRAETQLRLADERRAALLAAAPTTVFELDAHGVIEAIEGPQIERSLGIPLDAQRGRNVDVAYAEIPTLRAQCQRALAGESFTTTIEHEPVVLQVSLRARGKSGRVDGVIGVVTDITTQLRAQREGARLRDENDALRRQLSEAQDAGEVVSRSPQFERIMQQVRQVAATDASVLILGETGTGKEVVARAIHAQSHRAGRPLVRLNCAAMSPALVESELFGHERGAFTGATGRRRGRFELADGGTLLLDEVGDLPLDAQAKLLRVLQEGEFERVGGTETLRADVRILAATNRDLPTQVRDGRFRDDLYYRLRVFPIEVPPLRERPQDVVALAEHFVRQYARRLGRQVDAIDAASLQRLQAYRWPGNARELEHVVHRALIVCTDTNLRIGPELLIDQRAEAPPQPSDASSSAPGCSLAEVERRHIVATLQRVGWVVEGPRGAASSLDIHPNTLRSRMKKLGIKRAEQPER